jgi:hypothetical protein
MVPQSSEVTLQSASQRKCDVFEATETVRRNDRFMAGRRQIEQASRSVSRRSDMLDNLEADDADERP